MKKMNEINWDLIDDYEFVYLAADLLRRLGFVDIHVQGTGPDGGLDLIATELLSFAVQGAQPFRWGIQCKFSKTGMQMSVNDSEIKDVEGILRSDRYAVHDLRGYMIITNRKIVQNVLERLRGINRGSQFRTTYIDGTQLQHRLAEHPEVIEKYFGEAKESIQNLGQPITVAGVDEISKFFLDVEISSPSKSEDSITVKAILDTGAQMSVVPQKTIEHLEPLMYSVRRIRSASGAVTNAKSCFVDIRLGNASFSSIEVLALDIDYALLGQNLIKQLVILLDGPNNLIKVWPNV